MTHEHHLLNMSFSTYLFCYKSAESEKNFINKNVFRYILYFNQNDCLIPLEESELLIELKIKKKHSIP
jgi:hypothetical protein